MPSHTLVLYTNHLPKVGANDPGKIIKESFELTPPLCVRNAINDYREANDWLGNFIEANCEVGSSFEEKSGVLYRYIGATAFRQVKKYAVQRIFMQHWI